MAIEQDLPLVSTVAAGLSGAFICGLLASKLRISPIVGYLLAGIIIGPHSPGFVADLKIAEELSEIGIVLLMFGVGLHFSMNDFMAVKKIALTGALVRIAAATAMGAGLAHLWGWPVESGLLFGLALSVASTVVLLRALEERNLVLTMVGRIAIGWLIVEDLAMILAMILIPALAGAAGNGDSTILHELLVAIAKVGLFIAIMMVGGKRFLPWLLAVVARTRSRELFTLAVIVMAVGIAFGAAQMFGVSLALGAFFAGMMIRESDLNHEVADKALPFQDAFAVLFFVSVGMLFNPSILMEQPLDVAAVVAVIMVGKSLVAFAIVMMFGYPLKTALLVTAGLGQIGEFSFILVGMGLTYGLLPDDGRDLILAGALISIALKPLTFHVSQLIHEFVSRKPKLASSFNMRDDDLAHMQGGEKYALRELVILVGHGRVGKHISENITATHVDLVLIDLNRERVEALRKRGFHAIAGDAGHVDTLKEAAIQKAVAIAIAVPDPFEARRIAEAARALKPTIKILIRAHNEEEAEYFRRQNVDLVVSGPQEIGRRMVEYLQE